MPHAKIKLIEISVSDFISLISKKLDPKALPAILGVGHEVKLENFNVMPDSDSGFVEFKDEIFGNISLKFFNCHFHCRIAFTNCQFYGISFHSSELEVLNLDRCISEVFDFERSVASRLELTNSNYIQYATFRDSQVVNSIFLSGNKVIGQLGITGVKARKCQILQSLFGELNFYSNEFDTCYLLDNESKWIRIFGMVDKPIKTKSPIVITVSQAVPVIDKITLGPNFDNNIEIRGSDENYLNVGEVEFVDTTIHNSTINISDAIIASLRFDRCFNSGRISFYNVSSIDGFSLTICRSFLGKTSLNNFQFPNEINLHFDSSDIRELSYVNTVWPEQYLSSANGSLFEFYRQLKSVAASNFDLFLSVQCDANEKRLYRESDEFSRLGTGTKAIFWFNWISNRNNQSWTRPVFLNFGLQFVIFMLCCLQIYFQFGYESFQCAVQPWTKFLYMLNPAFNEDILSKELNQTFFGPALVFFSRIISSYLIVQTVSGFRRYNRS